MKKLSTEHIQNFINDGFVKVEQAFSTDLAAECRAILWPLTGCDPEDRATWTKPVIRIGDVGSEPFQKAANTPVLHAVFNQLAGRGKWLPRTTLGTFPVRFPGTGKAGDTGWHVDAGFPGENATNYFEWRVNIYSKGRALLLLFLFSDVSEHEAPTLIRAGSHLDVAKLLAPAGEKGLSFMELAQKLDSLPKRAEVPATGKAGTVYACHPFIVHAAQDHRGSVPKFMAQPPLLTKEDFNLTQPAGQLCPVEKAIVKGLSG